jgi:hypothetical protein
MINEKKLVWARLGDTCDDYMCSVVNNQISRKYLAVQIGKVSPIKVADATNIALDCIATFLKYFTTEEIKKAVKKLREFGYNLPSIELMRISPDIVDNVHKVGSTSYYYHLRQKYMQSALQGLQNDYQQIAIKNFSGISHKNSKGYSNKYYERYRNKSQP